MAKIPGHLIIILWRCLSNLLENFRTDYKMSDLDTWSKLEQARARHMEELLKDEWSKNKYPSEDSLAGHSAIAEYGVPDLACEECGRLNAAEYRLAEKDGATNGNQS